MTTIDFTAKNLLQSGKVVTHLQSSVIGDEFSVGGEHGRLAHLSRKRVDELGNPTRLLVVHLTKVVANHLAGQDVHCRRH